MVLLALECTATGLVRACRLNGMAISITMPDELERPVNACPQVLKANESFSQGFDKPMGLGVKKKVSFQAGVAGFRV